MKKVIKTVLTAILFLALSCKKENNILQPSRTAGNNATSDLITNITAKYSSVKIGSQKWMVENLDDTKYKNGDKIPQVKDATTWATLTTGAWCWYNNDSATGAVYGRLYNWYAVNDSRGLAPEGWHVPSDAEWTKLTNFLGGEGGAGGALKEAGYTHWFAPNIAATNSSGFTGLPGGYRINDGTFGSLLSNGDWWSSTKSSTSNAWSRYLYYFYGSVTRVDQNKGYGYSVRCLKDKD